MDAYEQEARETTTFDTARDVAWRFIAYRPRASREVTLRLRRAGYDGETIQQVVAALTAAGCLNDGAYARALAEELLRARGYGRRRIRAALAQKGLPDALIREALQDITDQDEVAAALPHLARKYGPEAEDHRCLGFLQRLGLDFHTARAALAQWREEEETN
jgi:regulatory protein